MLVLDTELVDEAPILDLRVRKARRRHGAKRRALAVRHARPERRRVDALRARRRRGHSRAHRRGGVDAPSAGATAASTTRRAAAPRAMRGPSWSLWGERLSHGARGRRRSTRCSRSRGGSSLAGTDGAGLLEIPRGTNGRGLREVGCLPNLGPGLADAPDGAAWAPPEIADALGDELTALVLLHADPRRDLPGPRRVGARARARRLRRSRSPTSARDALERARQRRLPRRVVRREGGHDDPPRRPPAAPAPGDRPPGRGAPSLARARRADASGSARRSTPLTSAARDRSRSPTAVPFYAGLTLDEIGGRGVRWQERDAASAAARAPRSPTSRSRRRPSCRDGGLQLGTVAIAVGRPRDRARAGAALPRAAPARRAVRRATPSASASRPGDEVEVSIERHQRACARPRLRTAVRPARVFLLEARAER